MQIKTDWLVTSPSRWEALAPYSMTPTEITFHNTDNDAPALNEVKNVYNNSTGTSFHTAVDDKEVQQVIPFNRNAWHAGDGGSGRGNRHSIGVEICHSKSGGSRYRAAELNAIDHISDLMIRFSIPIEKVKTHQERNGKYCPRRMLDEGRVGWFKNELVKAVARKKSGSNNGSENTTEGGKVEIKLGSTLETGGLAWDWANEVSEFMTQKINAEGKLVIQKDKYIHLVAEGLTDAQLQSLEWWVWGKGWGYKINNGEWLPGKK